MVIEEHGAGVQGWLWGGHNQGMKRRLPSIYPSSPWDNKLSALSHRLGSILSIKSSAKNSSHRNIELELESTESSLRIQCELVWAWVREVLI